MVELYFGVRKSRYTAQNARSLEQFLLPLEIVEFGLGAVVAYGDIRTTLEKQGTPIGPLDTLIAALAVSQEVTLVTNNVGEFARVPGLDVDDWISA